MGNPTTIFAEERQASAVIRLSKIIVDPADNRRGNNIDVRDLVDSLPDVGLLHPILVFPADSGGRYKLLAGHRRLCAARQLGWEEITCTCRHLGGLAVRAGRTCGKPGSPGPRAE